MRKTKNASPDVIERDIEALKVSARHIQQLASNLRSQIANSNLTHDDACGVLFVEYPPALGLIGYDTANTRVTGRMDAVFDQMAHGSGLFDYWCDRRMVEASSLTDYPPKPSHCCEKCIRTGCQDRA